MGELANKQCIPCSGFVPKFSAAEIKTYLSKITDWECVGEHHLEKSFTFPDFATALDFVNKIGVVAETEQHHPDIALSWGKVGVTIFTHKIDGLQEADFILADKVDACLAA